MEIIGNEQDESVLISPAGSSYSGEDFDYNFSPDYRSIASLSESGGSDELIFRDTTGNESLVVNGRSIEISGGSGTHSFNHLDTAAFFSEAGGEDSAFLTDPDDGIRLIGNWNIAPETDPETDPSADPETAPSPEIVDDVRPSAQATSPAGGSAVTPAITDISGIASDIGSGVSRVRVRVQRLGVSPAEFWNGAAWSTTSAFLDADVQTSGDSWTWTLADVDLTVPARYRVRVIAIDNAGNTSRAAQNPATDFSSEIADDDPPPAQATSPAGGSTVTPAITD